MTDLPPATGAILGSTMDDIEGTAWLLGHDLKSPVAIVISTLEVLLSLHSGDERMAHSINLIRGALVAANREYNMISDMLDLARLELKRYDLERQDCDVVALLRESLEDEAYSLTVKQLRVERDVPASPIIANLDVSLFRRIVSALVDNSIKFTVKDDLLRVAARRDGNQLIITFSDNGRPIFPDFEAHVAERAPQWDKRQAGSRTSVGMGLPFVNAVALAHGGSFHAHSDPVSGLTTFTLRLPVLPAEQAKPEQK